MVLNYNCPPKNMVNLVFLLHFCAKVLSWTEKKTNNNHRMVARTVCINFPLTLSPPGGGRICPLRLWSLPAAVWVVVETWHLMTFPLASSGTCWWNFFVEKLHSLAAGPRQSRPIGVFFLYQKYKSRSYANFYVTNHIFWYQLQI